MKGARPVVAAAVLEDVVRFPENAARDKRIREHHTRSIEALTSFISKHRAYNDAHGAPSFEDVMARLDGRRP